MITLQSLIGADSRLIASMTASSGRPVAENKSEGTEPP
jgi:hypothetical protein